VAERTSALTRPDGRAFAWLAVGVAAVSTSAPLVAATVAPALAIAFWRNALGAAAIAPVALARQRHELLRLTARLWLACIVAGVFLALHFGLWIPSLRLTSVASSTALVASQAAWAAVIARWQGHTVPPRAWVGVLLAFVGVAVVAGADFSLAPRALAGDALAVLGAIFAAAYVTVGAGVRQEVSTWAYTLIAYTTTALLLLVVCVLFGQALAGYSTRAWLQILAITVFAQLLGHTVFNHVLRSASPTVVSLAILLEVPGAALIAWVWLGQVPAPGVIPGAVLLLVGITLVVTSSQRGDPVAVPPVE